MDPKTYLPAYVIKGSLHLNSGGEVVTVEVNGFYEGQEDSVALKYIYPLNSLHTRVQNNENNNITKVNKKYDKNGMKINKYSFYNFLCSVGNNLKILRLPFKILAAFRNKSE